MRKPSPNDPHTSLIEGSELHVTFKKPVSAGVSTKTVALLQSKATHSAVSGDPVVTTLSGTYERWVGKDDNVQLEMKLQPADADRFGKKYVRFPLSVVKSYVKERELAVA